MGLQRNRHTSLWIISVSMTYMRHIDIAFSYDIQWADVDLDIPQYDVNQSQTIC